MEIHVIRHKTTSDYFRDFFTPDQAAIYSYQLQRMFESGAANEGDYFLVTDNNTPYIQAEIYRNNTRRIWDKTPVISPKAVSNQKKNQDALRLIFEFLKDDDFYHRAADRLEIVISEGQELSEIMRNYTVEFGYEKQGEYHEYHLNLNSDEISLLPAETVYKAFTDISPEDRFKLVSENNKLYNVSLDFDPGLLYQDYLDDGYFSEELWYMIYIENELSGFIMPVFTSGLKNKLRLANYSIINNVKEEVISKAIIGKMYHTAYENKIRKLEFIINSNDRILETQLIQLQSVKVNYSYSRYLKK